jgi:Phage integrase, N-terminal SAM-like domain
MSEKPISPLRQRMLEDMNMRRFVPDTQREYIRAVKKLASFLGRSPDTATPEELRAFQLHLTETGLQPQSINATVTALRFFFKVTLDRPETTRRLVFVYEPRKLPRVLSPEEVLRLLEAAPGPKHKAALSVAYGAGLRGQRPQGSPSQAVAEVVGAAARLVAHRASPSVDVPRPRPHQPDDDATAQPRLPHSRRAGRVAQLGDAAHVATQLRHAPARAEGRYSCDPVFARTFQARYHGALHRCGRQHHP